MQRRQTQSSSCYNLAVQTGFDFKLRTSSSLSDEDSRSWTSEDSQSTTASPPPTAGFKAQYKSTRGNTCPSLDKNIRALQLRSWHEEQAYLRRRRYGGCDHQASITTEATPCVRPPLLRTSISSPQVPQALPQLARQNSRRTQSSAQSSVCQTQSGCPPQLVRQSRRAQNFVENLVDTAAQMIEAIWPLSVVEVAKDGPGSKNLIDLRTFIQEVLRRSKTSYYTLQVALYYLILVKSCIPTIDFSSPAQTHAEKAMHCGRRMFLAALILASKYLQDRNYSAGAWSKISGLKVAEINTNEISFLTAVNWKLHIPENHFRRWSDILLKYSALPSMAAPSCTTATPLNTSGSVRKSWKEIVQRLTPDLDELDIEEFSRGSLAIRASQVATNSSCRSPDSHKTSTPATIHSNAPWTGAFLAETSPESTGYSGPTYATPAHPFRTLPTPITTPQLTGSCTPAVRTWSRGQSMKGTMQRTHQEALKSYSLDGGPVQRPVQASVRVRGDVATIASLVSSPESMVSDTTQSSASSEPSSSSSISSSQSFATGPMHSLSCGPLRLSTKLANHRSVFGCLNETGNMSTTMPGPYVVSGDDQCFDAEMSAILALTRLARPKEQAAGTEVRTIIPRSIHGQKRGRPLSIVEHDICEETRRELAQPSNTNESVVILDSHEAESFVLSRPGSVKSLLISGGAVQAHNIKQVNNQPPHKRQRNVGMSDLQHFHGPNRTVVIR